MQRVIKNFEVMELTDVQNELENKYKIQGETIRKRSGVCGVRRGLQIEKGWQGFGTSEIQVMIRKIYPIWWDYLN